MDNKPNDEIPRELLTDFKKVIIDMTNDILNTFPEYHETLHVDLKQLIGLDKDNKDNKDNKDSNDNNNSEYDIEKDESLKNVFLHCKSIYPDKFFDILYQTESIFTNDNDDNKTKSAEFLPGIDFKVIWKENISDKTRETIWKYLQLVLFTIITGVSNGESFGDTAKLFEAINQDEFKSKLEETISQMQNVFDMKTPNKDGSVDNGDNDENEHDDNKGSMPSMPGMPSMPNINLDDLPNPNDIHEHVNKMMDGKLGKLAREIAEETAADLNINTENAESVNDVFKRLFKNPTKLMGLVNNVGGKLDEKLKSGDINETELLKEASVIMQQMKDMPGMKNMMSKMGMDMGKMGGKMNTNAMQANLDRNLKAANQKDRMRAKLAERQAQQAQAQQAQAQQAQAQQAQAQQAQPTSSLIQKDGNNLVFSTGETIERSVKKPNKKKKNKNKK